MKYLSPFAQFVGFTPIDLKLADLYLYDGFSVSGVTNSELEPEGEVVIALDSCADIVPVGCTVKFGNDSTDTEYIVESAVTSGGTDAEFQIDLDGASGGTFTLTFDSQTTNAIAYDASYALIQLELEALDGIGNGDVLVEAGDVGDNDIKITFQDDLAATDITTTQFTFDGSSLTGTAASEAMTRTVRGVADNSTTSITLTEGLAEEIAASGTVTFTGRRLEIKVGEGNLNWTETVARDYLLDRGRLSDVRNGDETPMDVTFEFTWEFLTGVSASGIPTIKDVLKQRGEASDWVSTDEDECAPYCVDIVVNYDPGCGGSNSEKITLQQFRYETLEHNLRDSQISCSGKCNVVEADEERI